MTVFSASHLAASICAPLVAVETGAYRGWWWFYSPHKEEA
jgi:hypothetical protein